MPNQIDAVAGNAHLENFEVGAGVHSTDLVKSEDAPIPFTFLLKVRYRGGGVVGEKSHRIAVGGLGQ